MYVWFRFRRQKYGIKKEREGESENNRRKRIPAATIFAILLRLEFSEGAIAILFVYI